MFWTSTKLPLEDEERRPWRGSPPTRLPFRLRATLPLTVALLAAMTAALAWQWGWVALVVPVVAGAQIYRLFRTSASPPSWFRRFPSELQRTSARADAADMAVAS